jgi:hypothetical protein
LVVFRLKTYVLRSSLILYLSTFLLHFSLLISTVIFNISLGYSTSFSKVVVYSQVPDPIRPIDLILLATLISWFKSGSENSGVTMVILRQWSICCISSIVTPCFTVSTILSAAEDSIAAIRLYLILKVFRIFNFFLSGVLKQR